MNANYQQTMLDGYFSAFQPRLDSWNVMKSHAAKLADARVAIKRATQHKKVISQTLASLAHSEQYWGFPGVGRFRELTQLFDRGDYLQFSQATSKVVRLLMNGGYRYLDAQTGSELSEDNDANAIPTHKQAQHDERFIHRDSRPYFEVLVVDDTDVLLEDEQKAFRQCRREQDEFVYEPVLVHSFEDAVMAVLFNYNLQSVVIRYDFPMLGEHSINIFKHRFIREFGIDYTSLDVEEVGIALARTLKHLRPEIDIFLVTDQSVEEIAKQTSGCCRRVFYNTEDFLEMHLNILRGIGARYNAPFFSALKTYSEKPTGVFHAMPISRGKSIIKSHWIKDMGDFYGINTFLAETSATSGGLDSLLEPTGPIKQAQALAARAFGAQQTFFATNGTSTCNKIVVQALVKPNDIVLVDRDCHKSHHYGLVLSGAEVLYLDSYPLNDYSMYGGVPLAEIKRHLLQLKAAGKLDRVKMLLLTNCTFDGLVYDVKRYMQECLAIKPDLVFLWDEAWFGFARFTPTYRQRTGMAVADKLKKHYTSAAYKKRYAAYRKKLGDTDDIDALVATPLMPDPDAVKIRVYTTQSTHKTLTSLRQGSMIHIYDEQYQSKVQEAFKEAYMTHTSTSPNYQILASLDVGRRQAELEGFELVSKQVEMATVLRHQIDTSDTLKQYVRILGPQDMIPSDYRQSRGDYYEANSSDWNKVTRAWYDDDFVLDCTRITLFTGTLGVDGNTFKNDYLMEKYGIQVNKTSRNTVLFMVNIGTTRSSVAYLLDVLYRIVADFEQQYQIASGVEHRVLEKRVENLTHNLPPLPDFSYFHAAFRADQSGDTPEGKIRNAFFLGYDDSACEYLDLNTDVIDKAIEGGRALVSAGFVTPYPPGFPILVPGQVVSQAIVTFLRMLDVKEIHGFRPELGLRVFTESAMTSQTNQQQTQSAADQSAASQSAANEPNEVTRKPL